MKSHIARIISCSFCLAAFSKLVIADEPQYISVGADDPLSACGFVFTNWSAFIEYTPVATSIGDLCIGSSDIYLMSNHIGLGVNFISKIALDVPTGGTAGEDEDITLQPGGAGRLIFDGPITVTGNALFGGGVSFSSIPTVDSQPLVTQNQLSSYQPYSANLNSLAGLTIAANKGIYASSSGVLSTYDLTSAGRALLGGSNAADQRAALGLVIGTSVLSPNGNGSGLTGVVHGWGDLSGVTTYDGHFAGLSFYYSGANNYNSIEPIEEGFVFRHGTTGRSVVFDYFGLSDDRYYQFPNANGTFLLNVDAACTATANKLVKANAKGAIDPSFLRIPESGDLAMGDFKAGTDPRE